MRICILFAVAFTLFACSQNKYADYREKFRADIESKIRELGFEEQEEIEMEMQIEKQQACAQYGKEYWGETFSTDKLETTMREYRYSSRFDKCFAKIEVRYNYYIEGFHYGGTRKFIMDILSIQSTLFSFSSWCRESYLKSDGLSYLADSCLTDEQFEELWLALHGE